METTRKVKIKKIKEYIFEAEDEVAVEYDLVIYVNGHYFVTLLCTPINLEDLVAGYLYSEGVILRGKELLALKIDEEKRRADAEISREDIFKYSGDRLLGEMTVTTACGKGRKVIYPVVREGADSKITSVDIHVEKISDLFRKFNKSSELFARTGGVHSCALCSQSEILIFRDDIGRHNALDKILGKAMLQGLDVSDKMVLTTGRMTSEIVEKVALRGIPVLISRSAPTDTAIEKAKKAGIKLIGFLRGNRMNIYT